MEGVPEELAKMARQQEKEDAELWGNTEDTDSDRSAGFEVTKVVNMEDTNSDGSAGFEVTKVVFA